MKNSINLSEAKSKGQRILQQKMSSTFIFNFGNVEDMNDFIQTLNPRHDCVRDIREFVSPEKLIPLFDFSNKIKDFNEPFILKGFVSYLKLFGKDQVIQFLNDFRNADSRVPVILVMLQFAEYTEITDPRLSKRIFNVETKISLARPYFKFINKSNSPKAKNLIEGILEYEKCLSQNKFETEEIVIATDKLKENFCDSLIAIKSYKNNLEELIGEYQDFPRNVSFEMGSEENWKALLTDLKRFKSFEKFKQNYVSYPKGALYNFLKKESKEQWFIFFILKNENIQNAYLQIVFEKSNSLKELKENLLFAILDVDSSQKNFNKLFKQQRELIENFGYNEAEINSFILRTKCFINPETRIKYLTDKSRVEKEAFLEILSEVGRNENILSDIKNRWKDLKLYLETEFVSPSKDGSLYRDYFLRYKKQKLFNTFDFDFNENVKNMIGRFRDFDTRQTIVNNIINKYSDDKILLYFVDGLGIEFNDYIACKSKELNLNANVKIGQSNLPTITECNKEFLQKFKLNNQKQIKDFDELKHEENQNYNYEKTKIPLHFVKELEILEDLLQKTQQDLQQDFNFVIWISDHGSTRLPILCQGENKIEIMDSSLELKGSHGGRVLEGVKVPIKAIEHIAEYVEDKQTYSSYTYQMFKGGRIKGAELHGGATLEEVLVPIIMFSLPKENVDVKIIKDTLKINKVSDIPILEIFISREMTDVEIKIKSQKQNENIIGERINKNHFLFKLKGFAKGHYTFDLFADGELLKSGCTFKIEGGAGAFKSFF